MTYETWVAFTLASAIISIIPGPSVFTVLSQSISFGFKAASLCILGDVIGAITVMALSYIGVGAIFAASETLFLIVKWSGVCYIAYLGITQILAARKVKTIEQHQTLQVSNVGKSIRAGFFTGVLNPKGIIFSMAFLSQFIDMNNNPLFQFSILAVTNVIIIAAILGGYAFLAHRIKKKFDSAQNVKKMNIMSGTSLCASSLFMIFAR